MPTLVTTGSTTISRSSSSGSSQSRYDLPFSWTLPPNTRITRYYWTFDIPTTSGYYSTWSCYYDQNVKWGRRSTAGGVTFDVTGSYSGSSGTARIMLGVSGTGKTTFTNVRFCADYEYTATASTWSLTKTSVAADGASAIGVSVSSATSGASHRVTYAFGSLSSAYSLAAGTNSHSMTVPLSWCAQIPNATSGTGAVTVETIYNGAVIGSETKYFTVTVPASAAPSIGGFTATGNDLKWSLYLAGISTATLKITGAAGAQGSTITRYRIEGGGFAADAATLTTGALTAGTIAFTATVWDSRGRTATKTLSITVKAYQKPSITSVTTSRCDASGAVTQSGTYIRAVCNYAWTSVGSNARTLKIEYRPSGGAWSTAYTGTPASGAAQVFGEGGISVQKSYEVRYTLADSLYSTTATAKVPTGYVYMRWDPPNNRFGFGCYPEGNNRLQIADGWDIYHRGRMLTDSTKIPAGADLNNYETPGMYYNGYNKNVETMANVPTAKAFSLLVEKHAGVKQTFTQYWATHPRTWVRNKYNSTWGPWVEQLDAQNWQYMVYPVGTVYMSTSPTSPASLFGGTWAQIKDRFLLGAGGSYGAAGNFGGSNDHVHGVEGVRANIMVSGGYLYYYGDNKTFTANYKHSGISTGTKGSYSVSESTTLQGSTSSASNMPLYMTVYMWWRQA